MPNYYASDEEVQRVINFGNQVSNARWVYTESEADAKYYAIIHDLEWMIAHLQSMLEIKAVIRYAVASSPAPFQVTRTTENEFLILIDCKAYYDLLRLIYRVQTLPSFSEFLGTNPVALNADYSGMYLLDIIKKFLKNPIDLMEAVRAANSRIAYQAALLFIIGHEVAHITHGHLDFKNSSYYKEFTLTEQEKNLTLRTLEMDADSSGATNVSATMEYSIQLMLDQREVKSEQERLMQSHFMRRQYISGIFVAQLYSDSRIINFFTPKYPSSYARFLTVNGVLEIALKNDVGDEASKAPEQVRKYLTDSFAEISGSLGGLGHPVATNVTIIEPFAEDLQDRYDEFGKLVGLEQLEPLHSRWSRLRPILERYKLGGKLAPAIAPPA